MTFITFHLLDFNFDTLKHYNLNEIITQQYNLLPKRYQNRDNINMELYRQAGSCNTGA